MPVYSDQTGRQIELPAIPTRIISLVPSQTELLYSLGLTEEVVGITKFCVHPASWFRGKTKVGGTKTVNLETVDQLKPDLIIANKEENLKDQVLELANRYPVWVSDVNSLDDACQMIHTIGTIVDKLAAANHLISGARHKFSMLPKLQPVPSVAYLIWNEPIMTVGGDTFIHSMIEVAGFRNVFADRTRYPEVSMEDLFNAKPDFVFLSSEPFPFTEKHASAFQLKLPSSKITLVDGEMFSWYGSRMLKAGDYFRKLTIECGLSS